MSRGKPKVFGVGLSKTGTTSVTEALRMLGYRTEHYFFDLDRIEELDAAMDTPIARAYKELDRKYPGSRFILTVREESSWLRSCADQFSRKPPSRRVRELRLDLYGTPVFEEEALRRAYRRHRRDVSRYFGGRPRDLLVLDVCAGEGWEALCPFLGRSAPATPFPHLNAKDLG